MKILVVFYSRTGHSRELAYHLAEALEADLEEIGDRRRRAGRLGWLRSGVEGYFGRASDIAPSVRDPSHYDLVVVGGPVWSSSVSSPVRAYLRRHRHALPAVAFFCTCGGTGGERAFTQMTRECDKPPAATLIVRQAELPAVPARARAFAAQLREVLSVPDLVDGSDPPHAAPVS